MSTKTGLFSRIFHPSPDISESQQVAVPNVDEVLDIGYALHASDDPSIKGTEAQEQARDVVFRFRATHRDVQEGSVEAAYLDSVSAIILAHARGITRRKNMWREELESALLERGRQEQRIKESRWNSSVFAVAWKLLGPVILLLSGYLVGKVIALIVPAEIAHQTGDKLPAIVVGLSFAFIGKLIASRMNDLEWNRIHAEYRAECYRANLAYELGKREEYKLYRARLCEAWKEYTGKEYPVTVSYEIVMAGDIETRRMLEHKMRNHDRQSLKLLMRLARILRGKKKKVENSAVAAA